MKIVPIFADKLFAFHYAGEEDNELKRLLNLWNDTFYLFQFLKANKNDIGHNNIEYLIGKISDDANTMDELLYKLATHPNQKLESFFKQLHNSEYQFKILSLQKGRKNYLRIYALKIDDNCFVVTGGAIKFTHLMEDRPHTLIELQKLQHAKQFLDNKGVFDSDSFFEFLIETE